jgi:hypothetical protein
MPNSENNLVVMDLLRPKVNVTNNGGLGRTIFGVGILREDAEKMRGGPR